MLVLARSCRTSTTEGTSGTRTSCGATWGVSATSFSGMLRGKRNRGGVERQGKEWSGIALSHRIPLAKLKCLSDKRRKELAARLGGEPGGARRVESARYGHRRSLFRFGA